MDAKQPLSWPKIFLSAVILILSFPNPLFSNFYFFGTMLAWVALAPLFAALEGRRPWKAFHTGWLIAFIFYGAMLVWINNVRPMGWGAPPAWLALSAYNALWVGLFSYGYSLGREGQWRGEFLWVPALWTACEFGREHFLDGFPWAGLGTSQAVNPVVLDMVRVTGIHGLHFFVAASGWWLWTVWQWRRHRHRLNSPAPTGQLDSELISLKRKLIILAALAIVLIGYGKMWKPSVTGLEKVGVVQVNVDPDQPWDLEYRDKVLGLYRENMTALSKKGAGIVVWPETNFPGIFNYPSPDSRSVRNQVDQSGMTLVLGSNETDNKGGYWNSSFLVEKGREDQVYRKRHLVAYGEYIPLRQWIPFLDKAVKRLGVVDFLRGEGPAVFQTSRGTLAPIICWETVFPYTVQEAMALQPVPEMIVLQTYDGWFGRSSAPWYLAGQAVFRAVESGRWVVRAATTGVSCFVDWRGKIHGLMGLGERGHSMRTVERLAGLTPYQRLGDWVAFLSIVIVLFCGLMGPANKMASG